MGAKTVFPAPNAAPRRPKWQGSVSGCGVWNTLVETVAEAGAAGSKRFAAIGRTTLLQTAFGNRSARGRPAATGIGEFDRALGGGLVAGGVVPIGGDPVSARARCCCRRFRRALAAGARTLYVSGEESASRSPLRARRLALDRKLKLLAEINLEKILATLQHELQAAGRGDRLDPDAVVGTAQFGAGFGGAGARMRGAADPAGQTDGRHRDPRRPRDQRKGALAGPRVLGTHRRYRAHFEGDTHSSFRLIVR